MTRVARRSTRAAAGFTLVELIVASTIVVMVAGAALLMLNGALAARQRIDRQRELEQQARAAVMAVAAAVRNAYRPTDLEEAIIETADDWVADQPRDHLRLFTVSRRPIRPGQPESDVREVEFFILDPQVMGSTDPSHRPALMRRTDPTRNLEPDGGGVLERVAVGVAALNITLHDGVQWHDQWTEQDGWPVAVRIQVAVSDGPVDARSPADLIVASRLVNFPHFGEVEPADAAAEPTPPREDSAQ